MKLYEQTKENCGPIDMTTKSKLYCGNNMTGDNILSNFTSFRMDIKKKVLMISVRHEISCRQKYSCFYLFKNKLEGDIYISNQITLRY